MAKADLTRAAQAITDFLAAIGAPVHDDPELTKTGELTAHAYANELLSGYGMDPAQILAEKTAATEAGLVVLTHTAIHPICPHHLLPAVGFAHVAYLPSSQVVGLGALGRLVHCYARRLILQEELAKQITLALQTHVAARWAGCIVELKPLCVAARGARCTESRAITSFYTGEAGDQALLRQELLAAINTR